MVSNAFSSQTLQIAAFGKCWDFVATPGYGLRCKVSGVESLADAYEARDRVSNGTVSPSSPSKVVIDREPLSRSVSPVSLPGSQSGSPATYDVLIGNREWMRQHNIDVPIDVDHKMLDQEKKGQTAVLIALNGKEHITLITKARLTNPVFQAC